jgi:hypothetical protein
MTIKVMFAALIVMLSANANFGQAALDIEKKYGKPVNVYSVSEHVWMTPEYAADGQICRATLYQKRISAESNHLGTYIPIWEVLSVFNELAPPDTRGAKKADFGGTDTSASMAWTIFPYEKVTFSFWVGFKFGSIADMKEKGVPIGGRIPTKITGSDDAFMTENAVNPEIIYIRWNDRKCDGK